MEVLASLAVDNCVCSCQCTQVRCVRLYSDVVRAAKQLVCSMLGKLDGRARDAGMSSMLYKALQCKLWMESFLKAST
jgi:hypothetical protein